MIKTLSLRNLLVSVKFDIQFLLKEIGLSYGQKLTFVITKYLTIIKYYLKPNNEIIFHWQKRKFHIDNILNVGTLQATYLDNAFLINFIPRNPTIIDVGANIGQFRIFSETSLKAKKVYSIEPITSTFAFLQKNFHDHVYKRAISVVKEITFRIYTLSVFSTSMSDSDTNCDHTETISGSKLIDIPDILKLESIDLLKIDVEGTELDALLASKEILKKVNYLLIEVFLYNQNLSGLSKIYNAISSACSNAYIIKIGKIYSDTENRDSVVDIFMKLNK